MILILQVGGYEDRIVHNSTFDEGEWNGDGEFNSVDLALAIQYIQITVAIQVRSRDEAGRFGCAVCFRLGNRLVRDPRDDAR